MSRKGPCYQEWYRPLHVCPTSTTNSELAIDPQLLEGDIQLENQYANDQVIFFDDNPELTDIDNFFDTFDSSTLLPPQEKPEQLVSPRKHAGVQAIEKHRDTAPAYFADKGIFSEEEKTFIHQFCNEKPSSMMERLKERDPAMAYSYRQVKGAVENERRKKNRREQNGPWTRQEMQLMAQHMELPPKELICLLKNNVPGFVKNVDQVRDMKSQIAQKTKGRVRHR